MLGIEVGFFCVKGKDRQSALHTLWSINLADIMKLGRFTISNFDNTDVMLYMITNHKLTNINI